MALVPTKAYNLVNLQNHPLQINTIKTTELIMVPTTDLSISYLCDVSKQIKI